MKIKIAFTIPFLLICVLFLGFWAQNTDTVIMQEVETPTVLDANNLKKQNTTFKVHERLTAHTKYSLCFQYNTTGLASPALLLSDTGNSQSIQVDLPRNTWGLGDACLKFQTRYSYSSPRLTFMVAGDSSSLTVNRWELMRTAATPVQLFDHLIVQNQYASVFLENSYLKPSFWLPLAGFILLWLGSGLAVTSLITNLNKLEIACIAPVTGAVIISFCAYFLSLIGIYKVLPFIILVGVIFAYALYVRREIQLNSNSCTETTISNISNVDKVFDLVAVLLIGYMMYKYIFVAFTPFYATWDGLVSWNKWGADWSLREIRGNYQFTYPQLIPLFYSAYYKLTGYSASNPLALEMNSVHFFITYLGLLALPLLFLCSKAIKVAPVIPVSILLLSNSFFNGMNKGYIDNVLVSYYLVCILLIVKVGEETFSTKSLYKNSASMFVMLLIAAGAIFVKQTGLFASIAITFFLWKSYRRTILNKKNIIWFGILIFVPAEFYFHEIILDIFPSLVEDNPLNHSIGGMFSNARTQLKLLPENATWYGNLSDKLSPKFIANEGVPAFLFGLGILGIYVAVLYKLFRAAQWRLLIVWSVVIGGLLLIAIKFGVPGEQRYVLLKEPLVAILAGMFISWLSIRLKPKGLRNMKYWVSSLLILVTVNHLYKHTPTTVLPSANGFDMISYEARLGRFFNPEQVRIADYLVSQRDQSFRFFTESTFVVWPNTIYDGFTKSTPTKMSDIYQVGDYFYSMLAQDCPKEFRRINIDVGTFVFCIKEKYSHRVDEAVD